VDAVASYVVQSRIFTNVNGEQKSTRTGSLLTQNRRSLLGDETILLPLAMPTPWLTSSVPILIWIGQRNKGNKQVFEYELKPYAFPAGGSGRYRSGWLILQDNQFKDFFEDQEVARTIYESLVRDQEEKE
tara:strand:- start:15431 stop:15820 length:390 start_codon:yes stop_codon:yes gene_type:complete